MYDELVKRLREDAEDGYLIYTRIGDDIAQAADAIAELISKLNHADAQIQSLVEAAEERRWIPVTERLPEIGEYVLAYLFNRSPYIAWIDRTGQWQTEEFWLDAEDEPKAWMPLPEPYEPPKEET